MKELWLSDKMKIILVIVLVFGFIGISRAQKCSSPDITNTQFVIGYDFDKELSLKFTGVIKSFQMVDTVEILATSNNNFDRIYIDARYYRETRLLELFTTEDFPKYIEQQTSERINIKVTLKCGDHTEPQLLFRLYIQRENLYDPKFVQDLYNFSVPLPLYKGFDLTLFQKITARDIDIFDNAVTFTSSDSGLINVGTSPIVGADGKSFSATLILTAPILTIADSLSFTITATDSGTPPRSSIARVIISSNKTVSLVPDPRFEKVLYQGNLTERYSLNIETVALTRDTWSNGVVFKTDGRDRSLFAVRPLNNEVIVSLARPITEADVKDRNFFSFSIVASKTDVLDGMCSVLIELPRKLAGHQFSKSHYIGSLDSLGNLLIENIAYDPNNYSPEIVFRLNGPDRLLFTISNIENRISIGFSSNTQGADFRNRQVLFVLVVAIQNGIEIASAGVSISLPKVPRFDQPNYSGRINKDGSLYAENIYLESNVGADVKSISIRGENAEKFEPKRSNDEIRLELKIEFTEREIRSLKFISLTLIAASNSGVEGSAQILIDFPNFLEIPQFEQALYKGIVNSTGELILDDIVLTNVTYTEGIDFQLQGDAAEHFELDTPKNVVKIRLVKPIPALILRIEDYLVLILVARNTDGDSGSTSILLDLPTLTGPEFSKSVYKGTLDRYYKLSLEAVSIKPTTFEDGIELSLTGDDGKYFKVKLNNIEIVLDMADNFDPNELYGRSALEISILAKTKSGLTGNAMVIVEIATICAEGTCPPCSPPTDASCPEVSTPDPSSVPVFDRQFYSYRIDPDYTGVLGTATAKIRGSNNPISYSIEVSNVHLRPRLSIQESTGILQIQDRVSPGLYTFQIFATNSITHSQGSAIARIIVDAVNNCPNGTMVSSSLIIKHIAEEEIHTDLLYTKYGRCMFTVFSMEPDDKEYVQIDPRTNQLASIAIDREDQIFSEMAIPQIQIKLKLNCPGMTDVAARSRRSISDRSEYRSLIFTDDIPFDPYATVLSLVLVDVNDHSPEFIYPPRSDFVVGYPEVEVLYDLMPEHLIQIATTDKDVGLNAQIRYSLNENSFFKIHPTSGVIYPLSASINQFDDFELIVTACDRDGASDGRKTTTRIIVRTIISRHLTLLTLGNRVSHDLDGVLKNMSEQINMDLYDLRHAMMPHRNGQNKDGFMYESYTRLANLFRQSDNKMILKSWVYAVDNKNQFVDGENVEQKLAVIRTEFGVETAPYNSERQTEKYQKSDTTGLITGISLLGAILALAIVGAILFWWFWLKPYHFKTISTETTSETISSDGSVDHDVRYKSPSNIYYEEDDDYNTAYKNRDPIAISGTTNHETSDESNASSYEGFNDSDNSRNEKRKSMVTFNELVERIDIEIGHNNFRRNNEGDGGVRL